MELLELLFRSHLTDYELIERSLYDTVSIIKFKCLQKFTQSSPEATYSPKQIISREMYVSEDENDTYFSEFH